MTEPKPFYTVTEAVAELGVTKVRMAQWIREGKIETVPSEFDKRVKLIPASEIARLQAQPRPAKNRALAA